MADSHYTPGGGLRPFTERADAFRSGDDDPRAFLDRCIGVIDEREPDVAAFAALDLAGARAAADAASERWAAGAPRSPLDGCPFGVKDIIHTRGLPTQMNSALYSGWFAPEDALCVAALHAAGAVLVGKTQTTEFAVGESAATTNPWDATRTPGGSSSGSAAAVGCGMLPLALGTQTVGSILRPSSFCGAYGYKASHGALSLAGIHPLSRTLDHVGPIAASIEDAWAAARAMQQPFGGDAAGDTAWFGVLPEPRKPARLMRVRVGGEEDLETDAAASVEAAIERLASAGVEVVDASQNGALSELESRIDDANELCVEIQRYEMRHPIGVYALRDPDAVGARIHEHLAAGAHLGFDDYRNALAARDALRDACRRAAADVDGFVLPSASGPAPEGLAFTGARTMLAPWSLLGAPAWSLPIASARGLPLGLQLAGAPGDDDALAGIARWVARELGDG